MSNATDEFQLDLSLEDAHWACREALVEVGWGVESIELDRLVTQRSWWGFARDPARIEVTLSEAGPAATMVSLEAHLRWWPGGQREIDNEMNRLRNAIEVAAHRRFSAPPHGGR